MREGADVVRSVEGEFLRYKGMAEGVFEQLSDEQLGEPPAGGGNPIGTLARHIAGNLTSRFTEFLTTDGEKPWREREDEFRPFRGAREELLATWERGWDVLRGTLTALDDAHLGETVTIRGVELTVAEALHRSLTHVAYHVGQMVSLGRALRGEDWTFLSIPPGGTEAYNRAPDREKPRPWPERGS